MSKEALKLAFVALDVVKLHYTQNRHVNEAITAIKEALAQPEQEPVAWKNAAIRLGEELSSVGPDGYYDMTAEQWLDWAIEQRPQGKNSLPPQRTWVGMTDDEIWQTATNCTIGGDLHADKFARAIEAKLKEKNV
jgi:hypothetical protein